MVRTGRKGIGNRLFHRIVERTKGLRRTKLEVKRWVARWANPAARSIAIETGGEFSTPGVRIGWGDDARRFLLAFFGEGDSRRRRPNFRPGLRDGCGRGLGMATANFSTERTIHEY